MDWKALGFTTVHYRANLPHHPFLRDIKDYRAKFVKLTVSKQLVRVGSGRFMDLSQIAIPAEYENIEADCHAAGHSLVYVALDDQLAGAISLRPTIRPEAQQITSALRERGIQMAIISGDTLGPTKKLAESLGI